MKRRVVVTGLGAVTPLGHNVEDTWENIKAGKSGVAAITHFDTSDFLVKIAAEVKDWNPADFMPAKEVRRRDRYQHFVVAAAQEAIRHSGLNLESENAWRVGTIIGSSVGGIGSYFDQSATLIETKDPRRISPFGIPMLLVEGGNDLVSIEHHIHGASYTPISACATGADCIGHAFDLIRWGKLDAVLAGCGDAPIIPIGLAAFDRVGAVSRDNELMGAAIRPFDKTRSGLIFGEGAGVVVLEELEHAKARGATIYAEVVGYGSSSDAFHITAPEPQGIGASHALELALEDAGMNVTDIHYINAHGTGTTLNDLMETIAVKRVFGEHAYNIPMSSTKSMTGHSMGATAAIEAVFSILAIRDQIAPPTINLNTPDPDCDLDYVPNEARRMEIKSVMSNSFGFGGHNASLIFKAYN